MIRIQSTLVIVPTMANTSRSGNSASDGVIGEYFPGTRVPLPLTRVHAVKINVVLF